MARVLLAVLLVAACVTASAQNFWQQTSTTLVAMGGAYNGILYGHNGRTVFRSTNNGVSWDSLVFSPSNIQNLVVGPNGHILLATSSSGMFRSTNGGFGWAPINSGLTITGVMRYPIFTPAGLFVGTSNAGVFRSTNGGDLWTSTSALPGSQNTGALAYDLPGNLYASTVAGGFQAVYKSTDNGGSWAQTTMPANVAVWSLSVGVNGYVFAGTRGTGASNGIYRSTDNGASWPHSGMAGHVIFNYPFVCLPGGKNFTTADTGGVFGTTDNGATWDSVNSGLTTRRTFGITTANGYLFVGTLDGVFRSTQTVTSVIDRGVGGMPNGFSLDQNYPNPFNPGTMITFQLPNSGHVSLKIYDLMGREMATLANEELKEGTYTKQFDAGGLASGTYYYRLQAGNVALARRMMLIR